jgi:hypothetical protein
MKYNDHLKIIRSYFIISGVIYFDIRDIVIYIFMGFYATMTSRSTILSLRSQIAKIIGEIIRQETIILFCRK